MTRETTDQLYIELDYFTPEEYYVYTAEAQSQANTSFSVSATVGVIKQAQSQLAVNSSVSATISYIEGADLFAFTEAQLAIQISLIKNTEITAASTFSVAIDFVRQRDTGSDQDAVVSAIIAGLRSRDVNLQTQAAFSLTASSTKIKKASLSTSAQFTQSVVPLRIRQNTGSANGRTSGQKTVTVTGNTVLSSAQSQFGGHSALFDGNGDRLDIASTADFGFGTGNITIEFWARPISFGAGNTVVDFRTSGSSTRLGFSYVSSRMSVRIGSTEILEHNANSPTNTWQHIAYTRQSNTHRLFVNGQLTDTATNTSDFGSAERLRIGERYDGALDYHGYIDDLRIIKGTALYTANFTAPTSQLTDIAGTVLLLNMNVVTNTTNFVDTLTPPQITALTYSGQATQSAQASRTRSTAISLSSNSTLSAQITNVKNIDLVAFTNAALSIDYTRIKSAASDLNSETTQSVVYENFRPFESDLDSAFAITAGVDRLPGLVETYSAQFGLSATAKRTRAVTTALASTASLTFSLRPWEIKRINSPISSSIERRDGVFDSAALFTVSPVQSRFTYVEYYTGNNLYASGSNRSFVVDFRIYASSDLVNSGIGGHRLFFVYNQSTNTEGWLVDIVVFAGTPYIRYNSAGNAIQSRALNENAWNHIVISVDTGDGQGTIYVNGSSTGTTNPAVALTGTTGNIFRIGSQLGGFTGDQGYAFIIDELRFLKGPENIFNNTIYSPTGTTTTVPTERYFNSDNEYTVGLFHFDRLGSTNSVDFRDDTSNRVEASASLASSFSLLANAIEPKLASASLTTNANIAVTAAKNVGVVSNLQSSVNLTADADRTVDISQTLSSEFLATTLAVKTVDITEQLASSADLFCIISHIEGADMVAFSASTLAVDADVTKSAVATMAASATQTASAQRFRDIAVNEQTAFSIDVQAVKDVSLQLTLVSEATLTAAAVQQFNITESYSSEFALDYSIELIKQGQSQQSSDFDISINSDVIVDIDSTMTASVAMLAEVQRLVGISSEQDSDFNQTADVERIRDTSSPQNSEFNQSTAVSVTTFNVINLGVVSELSCLISHIEGADLVAFANSTLTVDADAGKFAQSEMSSSASLDITISKIISGESNQLSESQLSIDYLRIRSGASDLDVDAETAVNVQVIRSAVSDQTADTALSCLISHIEGADLVAFTSSSCTATATLFRGLASIQTSAFTQSTLAARTRNVQSQQTAQFAIITLGNVAKLASASLNTNFAQTTAISKILNAQANISSALNFQVAVREIDFDTILQYIYVIPLDIREYSIKEETRIYSTRR